MLSKALFSWILALLLGLSCWGIAPVPAYAHRPHDVVPQVAVSPTYDQDSTVYVLARNNLLRSQDRGETWFRLNHGLDNRNILNSLAIAPGDLPVLFATTSGDGLYRSADGGNTWKTVNNGLASLDLRWVEVSPANSQLAFTQTHNGRLYRTDNGGTQWTAVLTDTPANTLAFSQSDALLLLGDDQGTLWQSEDNGNSWQEMAQLPAAGAIQKIVVTADGAVGQIIYVGTALDGVYQSSDRGQTFIPMNDGLTDLRIQDLLVTPNNLVIISTWEAGAWQWDSAQAQWQEMAQGLTRDKQAYGMEVPHFYELAVSPAYGTDHELFLGGFDGLFRSQEDIPLWSQLETLSPSAVIEMAVSPTFAVDQTIAIATYVGELYISSDGGETWKAIHQDLHLPRFTLDFQPLGDDQDPRRFFDIDLSSNYAEDETLFSTILYSKILHSVNGGENWSIRQLNRAVRGVSLAISPNFEADQTVFSTNQKGLVFRSQDGGKRYEQVGKLDEQPGNDSPSLVISPDFATDQTLFNTGKQGIYKSADAGNSWDLLTAGTELEAAGGAQIEISPDFGNDQTLFVGTRDGLYRTQDGGGTWQRLQSQSYGNAPYIEAIAFSPNYGNDQTVMVSIRGRGLFKSQDGGNTFGPSGNPDLAIARLGYVPSAGRALQFSPNYAEDNTLFGFGTVDASIYRSIDGGDTWEVLPIPRLEVGDIPPLGSLGTLGLFLQFNRRNLISFLILAVLAVAGYALFKRIPFEQLRSRQVRLLICAAGVAAALGWVAFERLVNPQLSAESGFFICLGFAALAWIVSSPWFFRRFVGETTAESLGAIRIITCATLVIMTLWMEDLPSSALLPVEIRRSMGVIDYFYNLPGFEAFTRSQVSLQLFEWLTALLLIFGTIGLKTRWVLPLGAFCYLILGGILRQYTWFYHTGLLPVYLLAVLSFTPCNDGLSVDRWLKQRRGQPVPVADEPAAIYGWSRYACWVILGVSYVQAGLSKIYFSGFYWWNPENLKAKLLSTTLEPIQTNWEVSLQLVNAPSIFFALLGIVGLYGEIAYGLVLFFRWAQLVMPVLMAAVHVGIWVLQNIVFLDLILIQLIFYDYTTIRRWLSKRNWFSYWLDKQSWLSFDRAASPTHSPVRSQRLFFYPIVVSVLLVSMSFIWVKHREFYPLTSLQMFSGSELRGIVGYNKLIAEYESGDKVRVFPDEFIYPPMNTRYRLTFRDCHEEAAEEVNKCNQLLQAFGDVHNRTTEGSDRVTAFEVERWSWNYRAFPSDPNHGQIEEIHRYEIKP
ncbi:MAG: hypothetical protein F6K42_08810 [Leptolyngbya sp. SIO1D8]|nr:hypothetical protein [Leptolyngbya sp. SIO1D8]